MGIIRSAFLVDEKGKIAEAWYKISPKDTPTKLLKALRPARERAAPAARRASRPAAAPAAVPVRRRGHRARRRASAARGCGGSPATRRSSPGTSRAARRCRACSWSRPSPSSARSRCWPTSASPASCRCSAASTAPASAARSCPATRSTSRSSSAAVGPGRQGPRPGVAVDGELACEADLLVRRRLTRTPRLPEARRPSASRTVSVGGGADHEAAVVAAEAEAVRQRRAGRPRAGLAGDDVDGGQRRGRGRRSPRSAGSAASASTSTHGDRLEGAGGARARGR